MICLVRPPAAQSFRLASPEISLPLGLAYVAGALEASGRTVRVVDAVAQGPTLRTRYIKGYLIGLRIEELVRRIPDDTELVGISVIFTHEWPATVRVVDLIKQRLPDAKVVLGGEHVTAMAEFCMVTSKADFLILGEGERPVVELANALETGEPLSDVDSLVYRDGDRVVINRRGARQVDVDDIARPAWHLFDVPTYNDHGFVGGMSSDQIAIPVLATRGCPYQCTYCAAPNMWTPLWIPRDPIKVVDEIEHDMKTYGASHFPFEDLTAIIRKDWIVAFCKEVLRRGLRFSWQLPTGTRSEAVDGEVAQLLARTNMIGMSYAPESGSETTRRLVKKKMSDAKLFASIEAAIAAKLNVCIFLVIGFPHDTNEHLAENIGFIDRLKAHGVNHVAVSYYMALPGTELFQSQYDAGKIILDRAYFSHIMQQLWLRPLRSYSDSLGRWRLTYWKLRLYWQFFIARLPAGEGTVEAPRRGVDLVDGGHLTKVERTIRVALSSAWDSARTRFKRGWVSRQDEKRMMADWDEVYREIRRRNLTEGVAVAAPSDTAMLHRDNVVARLRRDHENARSFPSRRVLPSPAPSDGVDGAQPTGTV